MLHGRGQDEAEHKEKAGKDDTEKQNEIAALILQDDPYAEALKKKAVQGDIAAGLLPAQILSQKAQRGKA